MRLEGEHHLIASDCFSLGAHWVLTGCSLGARCIGYLFLKEGPHAQKSASFQLSDVARLVKNKELLCVILAYSAHNWEVYAMFSWYKQFVLDAGVESSSASLIAFVAIGSGAMGCGVAGFVADSLGRIKICIVLSLCSSIAAATIGELPQSQPMLLVGGAVWSICLIGDSAQYSSMVTEVTDRNLIGTALTMQFAVGFCFTVPTMYIVPAMIDGAGWAWAWRILSPGSVIAAAAVWYLQSLPRARLIK